jgi:hypothetical protein
MTDICIQKQSEQFYQLQIQREIANEAFLNALTYVRPFEEVKKLFLNLKAIESKLQTFNSTENALA